MVQEGWNSNVVQEGRNSDVVQEGRKSNVVQEGRNSNVVQGNREEENGYVVRKGVDGREKDGLQAGVHNVTYRSIPCRSVGSNW